MWPNPNYHFEFAQPPFAWQKVRWPGLLLLIMAAISVIMAWRGDEDLLAQVQTLESRKTQLAQAQVPEKPVFSQVAVKHSAPKKSTPVLNVQEQKEAQTITRQLNIRWFDLLQALESRQIKEIALLQLLPDAGRGQFVLSGEAKDYTTLLKYIGHLQQEPKLSQVHLQKHQVNETHPQRPVGFEIQGGWQP
jgi:hypothetical protein